MRIVLRQQKKVQQTKRYVKVTCKKRLTSFELSEIIVEKGIRTRTELLAFANKQKSEGKCDIAEFIVNRGPRVVAEVLNTAWEMTNAQDKLEQSKTTRLELLQEAARPDVKESGLLVHLKCYNRTGYAEKRLREQLEIFFTRDIVNFGI